MNMTTGENPLASSIIAANDCRQQMPLRWRISSGVVASIAVFSGGIIQEVATADIAVAAVSTHDAPKLEGEADITHQLEHIRSGKKPNFNEVRACTKPLETTSPTDVSTLAAFCVTYGMKGPDGKGSDTAIVDLTKLSAKQLRNAGNQAETIMASATGGDVMLDTRVIKPSAKAKKAFSKMLKKNGGCVRPSLEGDMVADVLRETMPKLNKYPTVIAVTDKKNCVGNNSGIAFEAAGVANERSNVDVYNARTYKSYLPYTMGHEVGHNFGRDHFGTYMPFIAETYAHDMDVPESFIADGVLKLSDYQEASDYKTYDGGCTNLMGSACAKADYVDGNIPTLNTFQQDAFRWALDVTGANRDSGLRELSDKGHVFEANNTQTGLTAMVELEQSVGTNRFDYRGRYVGFDKFLVTPNKVKIPGTNMYKYDGTRLEYANSATTAVAALGFLKLKPGETVDVVLPGSLKQTVSVKMHKNGTVSVTSQIPENINEGNW